MQAIQHIAIATARLSGGCLHQASRDLASAWWSHSKKRCPSPHQVMSQKCQIDPNSQIHTASMYTSTWSARFSFCRSPSSTLFVEICRYWISAYGPSPGHWAMPFSWKKRLFRRIDCSKTKLVLMWWPLYLLLFQINRPQAVSNTPIVILLWLCSEWKHPVSRWQSDYLILSADSSNGRKGLRLHLKLVKHLTCQVAVRQVVEASSCKCAFFK